jgi:MFS family permease
LVAFVAARCVRHPAPLIEPAIVRHRAIAFANLGALLFFCAFGALLLGSVLFLTTVWHHSVLRAGLEIAPGPSMAAIFAFPGGVLGQRFGQRYVGAIGALLFAAGGIWFRTHMGAEPDYATEMLPAQLLGGTGVGLVLPTLSTAATGPLPPARFATGTAILSMSRQLGSALGVAILIAIIGHPAAGHAFAAFRGGWLFIPLSALVAGAVLLSVGPVRIAGAPAAVAEAAGQPSAEPVAA